jgi:hypothetical protein
LVVQNGMSAMAHLRKSKPLFKSARLGTSVI